MIRALALMWSAGSPLAELDAAEAEGGRKTTSQRENGGRLEVLPGQESATEEATGVTYALTWAQDDSGAISVTSAHLFRCIVPCLTRPDHTGARQWMPA